MARKPSNKAPEGAESTDSDDIVLLCGTSSDGRGVDVLRKRGAALQIGVVRPLEEGKPINGEVVKLEQRGNTPLFDVTVFCDLTVQPTERSLLGPAEAQGGRGHPPRVASDDYRKNWDLIWRRPASKPLLN